MKLALIGYGAMGQLVANQARASGDEIGATLTSRDAARTVDEVAASLRGHARHWKQRSRTMSCFILMRASVNAVRAGQLNPQQVRHGRLCSGS